MCDSRQSHSHISTTRDIILWQSHRTCIFSFYEILFWENGETNTKKI